MTNIRLLFSNQKYCEFITFTFYLFLFLVFIFVRLVLLLYQSYLIQNVQVAPYLCVLIMVRTRRSILIFYCSHSINCTFHMHFLPLTCNSHIPNITTFQYKKLSCHKFLFFRYISTCINFRIIRQNY